MRLSSKAAVTILTAGSLFVINQGSYASGFNARCDDISSQRSLSRPLSWPNRIPGDRIQRPTAPRADFLAAPEPPRRGIPDRPAWVKERHRGFERPQWVQQLQRKFRDDFPGSAQRIEPSVPAFRPPQPPGWGSRRFAGNFPFPPGQRWGAIPGPMLPPAYAHPVPRSAPWAWGPGFTPTPPPVAGQADNTPKTPKQAPPAAAVAATQDDDADGVNDLLDLCPGTKAGATVGDFGCTRTEPMVLRGVNFQTDSDKLTRESSSILDRVADTLRSHPEINVEIAGHTDNDGDDAHNQELSQQRAISVMKYLFDQGVPADNLQARGYGESMPVTSNDTPKGKAQNRRVELIRR